MSVDRPLRQLIPVLRKALQPNDPMAKIEIEDKWAGIMKQSLETTSLHS